MRQERDEGLLSDPDVFGCLLKNICTLNFFLKIIFFLKLYQTLKQCFIITSITSNFVKNAPLCVVFYLFSQCLIRDGTLCLVLSYYTKPQTSQKC